MAEDRDEDRTEPATPRRRQEARERGQVVRSGELSTAAVLLAAALALRFVGRPLVGGILASAAAALGGLESMDGEPGALIGLVGGRWATAVLGFLPFAGILLAAALAANLLQVGFLFTLDPLAPDLSRVDPLAGLGRILSARGLVRLAVGFLKLLAVTVTVFWTIWAQRLRLVELSCAGFEAIPGVATDLLLVVALRASLVLFVLALFEYGFQKWQYERDLRMSRREIREELRRFEGDPHIKQRRRAIQTRIALQRMVRSVPEATVVVTNPTHLAVALRYEDSMESPVVVAKGAQHLARQIREAALDHGVPLVERGDLAQALYRGVDVGKAIPAGLYREVAEILTLVYRLKGLSPVAMS